MEQLSEIFPKSGSSSEPMQPIELPRADLVALQNNDQLVPGQIYIANDIDWIEAGGTGQFAVTPNAVDQLPATGFYRANDFAQISWWGGDINWLNGEIGRIYDNDRNNNIQGTSTVQKFPFGRNNVYNNVLNGTVIQNIEAGCVFRNNRMSRGQLNLTGNASINSLDSNGYYTTFNMSSGRIAHSRIDNSTIKISGTGYIERCTMQANAIVTIRGSGYMQYCLQTASQVTLDETRMIQTVIEPNCTINTTGTAGIIHSCRFSNTPLANLNDIASLALYYSHFDGASLFCSGAADLRLTRTSVGTQAYILCSENAEIYSGFSQINNAARIQATKGRLTFNYSTANSFAIARNSSEYNNSIDRCTLNSFAEVAFAGTSQNCLLHSCSLSDTGAIYCQDADALQLYSSQVTTNGRIDVNSCIQPEIRHSTVHASSQINVSNSEAKHFVYYCEVLGHGRLNITGAKQNSFIYGVVASAGGQANATDHAGKSAFHHVTAGYRLEIGTNADVTAQSMFASGDGSAAVNRDADSAGIAANNLPGN